MHSRTQACTHTHTNSQRQHMQGSLDWHTHVNIYLRHLLCAHSSYLFYIEWIIQWYQKFTIHNVFSFHNVFTRKSDIRWYKARFFLWNTNNTDRNGVNKGNTYTKHSEKDNTGKCYLVWISVIPYHFKNTSPYLSTPPFSGKNLNPHFFRKFWKLKAPPFPFIKGGGSTMKQRFFQINLSVALWFELHDLHRCCLVYISIIILRHV